MVNEVLGVVGSLSSAVYVFLLHVCSDLCACVCMLLCVFACVCMYLHALLSLCTLVVRRQQVQRRHQKWCSAKWAVVSERLKLLRVTRVWESLTFLNTSS